MQKSEIQMGKARVSQLIYLRSRIKLGGCGRFRDVLLAPIDPEKFSGLIILQRDELEEKIDAMLAGLSEDPVEDPVEERRPIYELSPRMVTLLDSEIMRLCGELFAKMRAAGQKDSSDEFRKIVKVHKIIREFAENSDPNDVAEEIRAILVDSTTLITAEDIAPHWGKRLRRNMEMGAVATDDTSVTVIRVKRRKVTPHLIPI